MINLKTKSIIDINAENETMFDWIQFMDDDTIEVTINEIEKKGNTIKIIGKKKTLYNNA